MKISIVSMVFLILFWIVLSVDALPDFDYYPVLLGLLGTLSCIAALLISRRMDIIDHEGKTVRFGVLRMLLYSLWLVKEIAISCLRVAGMVLRSPDQLQPSVRILPAEGMTDFEKVTYANSITLTPGTLTLEVSKDSVTVHSIQPELLESLARDEMLNRVRKARFTETPRAE